MSTTTTPAVPTDGIDARPAPVPDVAPTADHHAGTTTATTTTTPVTATSATTSAVPPSQTSTAKLGPLIHMRPLSPAELPSHPDLAAHQPSPASQPQLKPFLTALLNEGHAFMTGYLPQHFTRKASAKASPPSAAAVEVLAHTIAGADVPAAARPASARSPTEHWVARRSTHANAATPGTASWVEFAGGLAQQHSRNEAAYTPAVRECHEVLAFAADEAGAGAEAAAAGGWSAIEAGVYEMVHGLPGPLLQDRVFAVLVVAGQRAGEFLDVQVPVDLTGVAAAKHWNDGKKTRGMYCSVEQGRLVEGGEQVVWQMATASDAGGALPMVLQRMAVPGAVVKDVGLFLGWCAERRKGAGTK